MEIKHSSFIRWDRRNQAIDPSKGFVIRDVNVFIFFEKRSFHYKNDDEKSKTKRSFFLKKLVF